MRKEKKFLSLILALAMVITVMPVFRVEAYAAQETIYYRKPVYKITEGTFYEQASSGIDHWEENCQCTSYTAVTSSVSKVTWGAIGETTWYVATAAGITLSQGAVVQGNVNLVLVDGCGLTITGTTYAEAGISVASPNALTVYAGSASNSVKETGTLDVTGGSCGAGIGGSWHELYSWGTNITINGGIVTATGGKGAAGIGGSCGASYKSGEAVFSGTDIAINGGTVIATGNNNGAGIGGGSGSPYMTPEKAAAMAAGAKIAVNGGSVIAFGTGGAGIGGGWRGAASDITINGGTITANSTGGAFGFSGIGKGPDCSVSATAIKVSKSLIVLAGNNNPTATSVFDTDIYAPETSDVSESLDCKRYVSIMPPVASVTSGSAVIYYGTVQDAVDAASTISTENAVTTVTLLKDVDLTSVLRLDDNKYAAIDLNGHVIRQTSNASVIYNAGNLTILDSDPSEMHYYTVNDSGLWVWDDTISQDRKNSARTIDEISGAGISAGDVVIVPGGAVTGGSDCNEVTTAYLSGGYFNCGGIYNCGSGGNAATLTMSGGAIIGNKSDASGVNYGVGGFFNWYGTVTMSGVTLAGNTAYSVSSGAFGGIYNYSGDTLYISGCSIVSNTANGQKYAVGGICNFSSMSLSGASQICCNTVSNSAVNSNLCSVLSITASDLTDGANVFVTRLFYDSSSLTCKSTTGAIAESCTESDEVYFHSDEPRCDINLVGTSIYIQKKAIAITAGSLSKIYDGTALLCDLYVTSGSLAAGDILNVTLASVSQTNAGTCSSIISDYTIMSGTADVTDLYYVTTASGILTVSPRAFTLISASDTKVYDGTPLTNYSVTVSGSGFTLDEGAVYNFTGLQTEVGSSRNTFTYTLNSNTKASNYIITTGEGILTVTAKQNIESGSDSHNSTSKVTVPVSGDKDTMRVQAAVSGSNATVKNVTKDEIVKVGTGAEVIINLTSLSNSVTGVTIPRETIENVAASDADGLEIKMPNGTTAKFDKEVLSAVASQAQGTNIQLVIDRDSKAENSMTSAQKETVKEMNNAVVLDAYFVSNGQRIMNFMGGEAEITAAYETMNPVRVWYVADDGAKTLVPSSFDGKSATFTVTHFSHYVVEQLDGTNYVNTYNICPQDETCVYAKFTDADTKEWYHDGVHFCVENGYMNGNSTTEFAPDDSLSRAMIVQILWNMERKPVTDYAMTFKDVPGDQWYTESIRWAQSSKVVEGYSDEAFGPDDDVTREQLAAILCRYARYKGYSTIDTADLSRFTDSCIISDWALDSVKWANATGIITGRTTVTIVPGGNATRAEAASMVQRFCNNVINKVE